MYDRLALKPFSQTPCLWSWVPRNSTAQLHHCTVHCTALCCSGPQSPPFVAKESELHRVLLKSLSADNAKRLFQAVLPNDRIYSVQWSVIWALPCFCLLNTRAGGLAPLVLNQGHQQGTTEPLSQVTISAAIWFPPSWCSPVAKSFITSCTCKQCDLLHRDLCRKWCETASINWKHEGERPGEKGGRLQVIASLSGADVEVSNMQDLCSPQGWGRGECSF